MLSDLTVGENLARLRGGISQKDLADRMRDRGWKWAQATVWNIERGERPLRFLEAYSLCEILGVQLRDLLGSEDDLKYVFVQGKYVEATDKIRDQLLLSTQWQKDVVALMGDPDITDERALETAKLMAETIWRAFAVTYRNVVASHIDEIKADDPIMVRVLGHLWRQDIEEIDSLEAARSAQAARGVPLIADLDDNEPAASLRDDTHEREIRNARAKAGRSRATDGEHQTTK